MAKGSRKDDRKELIAREVQQREAALGVPPELQIYVLREHFPDEGGPPRLYPRGYVDEPAAFDRAQWRAALAAAPAGWTAPELVVDRGIDRGVNTAEDDACEAGLPPRRRSLPSVDARVAALAGAPADFCEFEGLFVFSERAVEALSSLLQSCGTLLPVTSAAGRFTGFRLDAVVDALDEERSSLVRIAASRAASSIRRFSLLTERLGDAAIFRLPQYFEPLVRQDFVDRTRQAGLTGFQFYRVWPAVVSMWWQEKPC